ncbi:MULTISPECIES: hypothetical protein [Kitasatospora]|uniref:Uncharacterized protein n=1 Tax=Kitasatospora cystarginea TaxID=58350 RepID=A0ABN3EKB2_9ACTN
MPAAQAAKHVPLAGAKIVKMVVGGVDRKVAESHGFKVVTDPDGTQRVVPTASGINPDGTPYHAGVRPQNEVDGNCGDSYLYIHSVGGYVSEIETGFDLDMSAVAYHWQVNRSDNWGSDSHSWGGRPGADEHWHGGWDVHGGGATWELAGVVPASNVLLWDGEICHAGAPSDKTWVF